ncbi:GxxExxY protein [Parabacteroides sp. FAFU027]|uniref:GxxExxY protein n=1 Tax=Parabacteroides sp. FAFU027 TaxID=2922715 RepID=UPI001FAFBE3C|nr:GxxExxY protein [Parabacteroides sp. FAFU027]
MTEILYKKESYEIIGKCMEVYNTLGGGFLEVVYKDALEIEFQLAGIPYEREKEYEINYKGNILQRKFVADFVVMGKIILEVKAAMEIHDANISQSINYLAISKK